jgi:hypothetical protein
MKSKTGQDNTIKLIKADKTGWQRHWVRKMIHYKVRTSFHSCLGQGIENLRKAYQAFWPLQTTQTGGISCSDYG